MRTALAVACLSLLLAVGCHSSAFPLDPAPQADVDPALLGDWSCLAVPSSEGRAASLRVERARDKVYRLTFVAPDEAGETYEAHASQLGARTLLNVRELGPQAGGKPWTFVRYRLTRPHLLEVQIATQEGLEGIEESPGAMRAALQERADRLGMFEDLLVCVRQRQDDAARAR